MTEADLALSIVIVNWNVRDLLRACLASLRASPGLVFLGSAEIGVGEQTCGLATEVIVVDNASSDGSEEMVRAEFPWVRLVANRNNLGFTRGNNQALALSRGRYVLFLNPDTEVTGDALVEMLTHLDCHPKAGALGPQLRYGDGALQSSRRRFPTLAMALFESTPLAWHLPPQRNRWARRYHMDDQPIDRAAQQVDWVVGAALMARRQTLDQVGGFDEGYFMYSEELDWCRRAAGYGWQVVYLPSALVIHHEGKSSEQVVAARHIRFQTSKVRYFRKFHGVLPAEMLRAFLLGSFAVEWLIECLKWLAGSRRPLRRSRMAAYSELLRSGLRPQA